MKYLLLILPILALTGCTKLTEFELDYNTELVIQASSPISTPIEILSPEVETNYEAEFEENETAKDHVNNINLKDVVLTIKDPENENFDFLKSIDLFIDAENEPQIRIAYKNSVPTDIQELELTTEDENLLPYITSDKYQLKIKVVTDETYTNDITLNAYTNFLVKAELIK